MTVCGELREECARRFGALEEGLDEKARHIGDAEKEIVRLDTETRHVVRSLNALTRAMWAAALSVFSVLGAFLIWYIQSL